MRAILIIIDETVVLVFRGNMIIAAIQILKLLVIYVVRVWTKEGLS